MNSSSSARREDCRAWRRAAASTPTAGASSRPFAALANKASSGVVSQSAYDRRAGSAVGLPARIGRFLPVERTKMRRLQHRFDYQSRAAGEILLLGGERRNRFELGRFQRTAERFQAEATDKLTTAGRRRLARYESRRIAGPNASRSETLCGDSVRFNKQRRQRLGLESNFKPVNEILFFPLARGAV